MRLPDFYIIGAQKSGTASLVALLAARKDVFICEPREPMFFCRDDATVHRHTLLDNPALWRAFDWRARRDELVAEYAALFSKAALHQRTADTSTTYLVARDAARRIAEVTPQAKLIALLRNPIDRAYSAYYHHLKNFRVIHAFEDHLKFEGNDVLETGHYKEHLSRFLEHFATDQLLVLPFEQFVSEQEQTYQRVCEFLELPTTGTVPRRSKSNQALVPRFRRVQLMLNAALRWTGSSLEASALRALRTEDRRRAPAKVADKALRAIGRLNRGKRTYAAMSDHTRTILRDYYARRNIGLSDLTGIDFGRWWPEFGRL